MRKKNIIELGITAISILALLVLSVNGINSIRRSRAGIGKNRPAVFSEKVKAGKIGLSGRSIPAKVRAGKKQMSFHKLEDEAKNLEPARDPFAPRPLAVSAAKITSGGGLSLSGIIWDELAPLAIINYNVVRKGDKIDAYEVKDIKQDKVVLSDGVNEVVLTLD